MSRRHLLLTTAALLACSATATAGPTIAHDIAVLRGLDKVTARIDILEAPVGEEIRLGSLAIRARACYETPPTEPPESAAFLEIDDLGPTPETPETSANSGAPETVFTGWMFASTPGISALEHPVYDVWVIDCQAPDKSTPLVINPVIDTE